MRMRLGLCIAALASLSLSTASCKKPDIENCRRACWNGMKLGFWAKVDADVKGLTSEEAAKIRAQRELEFAKLSEREEDPGLMNCITNCQQNSNDKQVECMMEATTMARLESCQKN